MSFYNKLKIQYIKCSLSSVNSSKLNEPKEGLVGTFSLQLIGQKSRFHYWQLGKGSLAGLNP